jgi:phosphoglycolate phosphatase
MQKLGKPIETDLKKLSKFVGPPLRDCFRLTYNLEEELIDEACQIFRAAYEKHGQYHSTMYDGIEELLKTLTDNGVDCAVGTMKYELIARNMIKDKGLDKYFKKIYGSSSDGETTKAENCGKIMKELGHKEEDSVLVGDTMIDLGGAKTANIDFIAVTYGFGFNKETIKTDDMFSLCSDTKQIFRSLVRG